MGNAQSTSDVSSDSSTFNEKQLSSLVGAQHRKDAPSEPLSQDGTLSLKNVSEWEDEASGDLKVQLARTVLVDTDFQKALVSREARIADQHVFNLQVPFKTGPITNQVRAISVSASALVLMCMPL